MKFGNHLLVPALILFGVLSSYVLLISYLMESSYRYDLINLVVDVNEIISPLYKILYFLKEYERNIYIGGGEVIPDIFNHLFVIHIFVTTLFFVFFRGAIKNQTKLQEQLCFGYGRIDTKVGLTEIKSFYLGFSLLVILLLLIDHSGEYSLFYSIDIHKYYSNFIAISIDFTVFFFFFGSYLAARKCREPD